MSEPEVPRPDDESEFDAPELPPSMVAAAAAAGAAAAAAAGRGVSIEEAAEEAGEAAADAIVEAMGADGSDAPPTMGSADRRQRRIATTRVRKALKAQHSSRRTGIEVLADRLTKAASSSTFLLLHVLWFVVWLPWNSGLLRAFGLVPFDPYPFGFLTMVVSLEAIFLTIFVLMSQARESAIAELREEITLEVIFRMEEEVTKTLQLVSGLFSRLGYRMGEDDELRRMLQPLDAESIEKELMDQLRSVNEEASRPRRTKAAPPPPPRSPAA